MGGTLEGRRGGAAVWIVVVAVALTGLLSASAADAAALKSRLVSDSSHGRTLEITYQARSGEQNQLVVAYPRIPACVLVDTCVLADELEFADPGASITVQRSAADVCMAAGPVARCGLKPPPFWFSQALRVVVELADLGDSVRIVGPMPIVGSRTIVRGGAGNDAINTRNAYPGDVVSCGLGRDAAKVDARDVVDTTCESVSRP